MKWTIEAENFLREHYPTKGLVYCAEALGTTQPSIRQKASRLGLKKSVPSVPRKTHAQYEEEIFVKGLDLFPVEQYITSNTPIFHECYEGHQWKALPNNILRGIGCPYCSGLMRKTQEQYESQVPEGYEVLGTYINTDTHILHKHIVCGHEWLVRPHDLLRTGGCCPNCSTNNRNTNIPAYVYHVSLEYDGDTYYKIGVTKKLDISRRFRSDWEAFSMKCLWVKAFNTGQEAYAFEADLLKKYHNYKVNLGILKSGNTETISIQVMEQ